MSGQSGATKRHRARTYRMHDAERARVQRLPCDRDASAARACRIPRRRRSDGRAPRDARGSDACAPSRAPLPRASPSRSAPAREYASPPRGSTRARVDIFLRSIVMPPDRRIDRHRIVAHARRARPRDSASSPRDRETADRAASSARGRPRDHHHARGVAVESVDDARPRLVVARQAAPAMQQRVHERTSPPSRRRDAPPSPAPC